MNDLRTRRDPRVTRSAILDAAEAVFVELGFAATSVSRIALGAGVAKSLIHHHFGSKAALWQEVKGRRFEAYAEVQRELLAVGDPSVERFADSIRSYFRFLQLNPEYVRLNAWTSLEDTSLSVSPDPDLLAKGLENIKGAQRSGELRDDVRPAHVMAAFLALCTHWFQAGREWADRDAEVAEADQAYIDDVIKIFFEGLKPR